MPIIKDFRLECGDVLITGDEYCYVLSVKRVKEKGKDAGAEYWQAKTYHTSLDAVARALMAHRVAGLTVSNGEEFAALQDKFDLCCADILKAINEKV